MAANVNVYVAGAENRKPKYWTNGSRVILGDLKEIWSIPYFPGKETGSNVQDFLLRMNAGNIQQ